MIRIVKDIETANICDCLLKKLIQDEKKYNIFINENIEINEYFKNIIIDNNNYLLCYEDDENVVGYVFFKYIIKDERKGYLIDGIYVDIEYRNKGIAKSLINEGLKIIENKEIDFIDINVMYENEIAKKIYKSLGFNEFNMTMRKIV